MPSNDESINFHYDLLFSSSNFTSPPTLPHHLAPEHFEPGVSSKEQLHLLPPGGVESMESRWVTY